MVGSAHAQLRAAEVVEQRLDRAQNAFLVYYTRGFDGRGADAAVGDGAQPPIFVPLRFDGPGRARMEDASDAPTRQSRQFGYRNDACAAVDDALSGPRG